MEQQRPPDFATIADTAARFAFLRGYPETVEWLGPGTKLFKWSQSLTTSRGISPWWQFVLPRRLATGSHCPGIRDLQTYARRLGIHDRDYARTRVAVTRQWNNMKNLIAIELLAGAWGFIGKASGQLLDEKVEGIYLIGGEFQVWVPGLIRSSIRRIWILPYLSHDM
jgi:hypothetical protein